MNMQRTAEKWVYVAARATHAKDPLAILSSRKIAKADRTWILGLRGHNINNAAAAVTDYRTGEVLAYVGSASYTSKGNAKFQPQFDVLADGWRQPGSAIKPIDYAIGIDDKTLTASTMIMDVTTNFGGGFIPTQADKLERGPVRLREALQFSLNIPAIKATIMQGLDHTYDRTKDFGLSYPKTAVPVLSMGIGTLEVHPIDLLGAYGTIANGGVKMPRRVIDQIIDSSGKVIWPPADGAPKGTQVISPAAAYVITDILAGNTDKKVNPFWGKWAIFDGKTRRPAAYKTGTTSDNRDVAAYGFVAPPADKNAPAIAVGVWMGNSDNTPNDGKLSLDTSAPLWSAIMREVTKGEKIATFKPPKDIETASVDAFTGLRPGPFTTKRITEYFVPGHGPEREGDAPRGGLDRRRERPPVAGRVPGPEGHQGVLQPLGHRVQLPGLAAGQRRRGPPVRRGAPAFAADRRAPEPPTSTTARSRRSAGPGARRSCRARCARSTPRRSSAIRSRRSTLRDRAAVRPAPDRTGPDAAAVQHPAAHQDPEAALELDDRRPVAALAALAGAQRLDQRMVGRRRPDGVAHGAGPHPVDDDDLVEPGQPRVVEIAGQRLERLVDARAAQVERRRDGPGALETQLRDVRGRRRPVSRCRRRSGASVPSAGTRSSTSTVTRIPPASRVARRPPRSSAAIRPSQPPDRLRARSPSCHDRSTAGSATGSVLGLGQAREAGLGPGDRVVEDRRGDGLALERLAGRADLRAQVRDDALGLGPGGADRLLALAPRPSPLLLGHVERLGRAQLRRRAPGRAPRWWRPRSPGSRRASPRTSAGTRSAASGRRRRSLRAGRAARRSRTPGCRRAARSSGGRSATACRGRTRPRRCARPASCARRP